MTTKQIIVANKPNLEMVAIFLKNFFLRMLKPDGNTMSGRIREKKK